MEDVGYYVTCILKCILALQAWQCLTAGRVSSHSCLLLLTDLIRENAHHDFPILKANNYRALKTSCKNREGSKERLFFPSWNEVWTHICKGRNQKETQFAAAVSSNMVRMKCHVKCIQKCQSPPPDTRPPAPWRHSAVRPTYEVL